MIKTVIFDIGGTLVDYPILLNWSALYRSAFESVAEKMAWSSPKAGMTYRKGAGKV